MAKETAQEIDESLPTARPPRGWGAGRWGVALRWVPALLLSALIPVASPWLGELREAIEARLGGRYEDVLVTGLVAAGLAALLAGVLSIRRRRLPRYGLLAGALALVALQVLFGGQGIRRVDLVERVHLVEYALVAALYYAALRPRFRDPALAVLPILAATLVGVADETIQWLSAVRVGDLRDVALDAWAGVIGALAVLALAPPVTFRWRPAPSSLRAVRRLALAVLLCAAALFDRIGLGAVIHDPQAGSFVSSFAPSDLLQASDLRAAWWVHTPPPHPIHPLDREDTFLTEAGSHAQARNEALSHKAYRQASFENRILERWYAPYLDLRSAGTGASHRWPPAMRAAVEADARTQGGLRPGPYRSPALRDHLATIPRSLLWGCVALAAAGLQVGGRRLERSLLQPPAEPPGAASCW